MRYYLVGGAVRDLLLGLPPRELDWVFDGPVSEFLRSSPRIHAVGRREPVYLADGNDHVPLRGANITEDLAARDFTINALALEESGLLHAHPLALADLRDKILRPASPMAFRQDPARVFRAARFAALLPDFTLHPDTLDGMRQAAEEQLLAPLAAERVGREVQKALESPLPGRFLRVLAQGGCLAPWFEELEPCAAVPAGPEAFHGTLSALEHTAEVMDKAAALCGALPQVPREAAALAAWMALCHDLGKGGTDPTLLPKHIGHETRGETLARALARRLRLSVRWEKAGVLAARLHMKGGWYTRLRPGTRVDLLLELHQPGLIQPFAALVAADSGNQGLMPLLFADLARILAVSLPVQQRNQGASSGKKLRELRCQALAGQHGPLR